MKKVFESKILDDLFEIRGDELEDIVIKKYGKVKEEENVAKSEQKLINMLKDTIKDEKRLDKIFKILGEYEKFIVEEMCFWNKQYYKQGFIDGIYIKKEIIECNMQCSKIKLERNNINDTFFNNCYDDFIDYFEDQKSKKLLIRDDYKNLTIKLQEIKNKYPKVRNFIEDEIVVNLTNDEMKALLEIKNINEKMEILEVEEAFKIGIKEAYML